VGDDFDCVLCMKLLYEPVTTACGHSFCRSCLARALDHSSVCPLCRSVLHMGSDHPVSVTLKSIVERNFSLEYQQRSREVLEEKMQEQLKLPLFLLNTVALPSQSFPMHIFEPRYRLMLRRCLEGTRRFGLVCATQDHPTGVDIGTILEIKSVQMMADGRSYIETIGSRRFRILSRWNQDGYMCGKVEWIQDQISDQEKKEAEYLIAQIKSLIVDLINKAKSSPCGGLQRLMESAGTMPMSDKIEEFSFWVASHMPLSLPAALQILQTTNSALRLRVELDLMQNGNPHSSNCIVQ